MAKQAVDNQIIADDEIGDEAGLVSTEESDNESDTDLADGDTSDSTSTDTDTLSDDSDAAEIEDEGAEELLEGTPEPTKPTADATQPPKSDPQSFTFKGDKTEHVLEGAQLYPGDGLYVPEKALPGLRQKLAKAAVYEGSWQQTLREKDRRIAELSEGRTEKDEQADAIAGLFSGIVNAQSEDEVIEEAIELFRKRDEYRLEIRQKQLDRREQMLEQRNQPSPEEVEAEEAEIAETGFADSLDQIFQMPFARVLNEDDRTQLREDLSGKKRSLLRTASRDIAELGLTKGDRFYDGAALLDYVQTAARIVQRKAGSATATDKAAEQNRRRTGSNAQLPPTPGAQPAKRPATAPSTEQPRDPKTGRFADRSEYEDYMRSDMTYDQWRAQRGR